MFSTLSCFLKFRILQYVTFLSNSGRIVLVFCSVSDVCCVDLNKTGNVRRTVSHQIAAHARQFATSPACANSLMPAISSQQSDLMSPAISSETC